MDIAPLARILIVDDETAHVRALCDTLRDQGYETTGFTSGEDALRALQEKPFELLLTDLMMPGMDGVALLAQALKTDPHLVGILMTGKGTIETAVQAMQAGALDYIVKPLKVSAILPVISRAAGVRRLRLENSALQEGLRKRTAELEAANAELESFSYSVSHDLRAPLRAMDGYARMLQEDCATALDEEGKRLLGVVRAEAKHMGQLIDDLLAFSRTATQRVDPVVIDMAQLAREAADEALREYPGTPVQFGELPLAMGDRALLRQVWTNLIGNALKYSSKVAAPCVGIGGSANGAESEYWVRDNGAGFDPRYADKLFAVFRRLHADEDFPGSGVGLAIVRRIVTRHGGRVWAEGKPGNGACFGFALPLAAP